MEMPKSLVFLINWIEFCAEILWIKSCDIKGYNVDSVVKLTSKITKDIEFLYKIDIVYLKRIINWKSIILLNQCIIL